MFIKATYTRSNPEYRGSERDG